MLRALVPRALLICLRASPEKSRFDDFNVSQIPNCASSSSYFFKTKRLLIPIQRVPPAGLPGAKLLKSLTNRSWLWPQDLSRKLSARGTRGESFRNLGSRGLSPGRRRHAFSSSSLPTKQATPPLPGSQRQLPRRFRCTAGSGLSAFDAACLRPPPPAGPTRQWCSRSPLCQTR